MRTLAWALVFSVCFVTTAGREPVRRVIEVSTAEELMAAFREPLENVTVQLAPGTYPLTATPGLEPAVDYCGENAALVPVTVGLVLSGRDVRMQGPEQGEATIVVANASHGLYLKDCNHCVVERLTITGSVFDSTAYAAGQGSVVVRNSNARIAQCVIRDNIGSESAFARAAPNPAGVVLGDGARMTIEFNEFIRNAVGITMHRGSEALIRHNLMEQGGSMLIRVGCDATATIERNYIRHARMAGIIMAEHSRTLCSANIVENCSLVAGIGVMSHDAAQATVKENVVYRCRAGIRLAGGRDAGPTGVVSRNILVQSGMDGAISVDRAEMTIRKNTGYGTEAAQGREDVSREMFWRARRQWTRTYRNTPVGVDGRHRFHESAFLTRYGRWMD